MRFRILIPAAMLFVSANFASAQKGAAPAPASPAPSSSASSPTLRSAPTTSTTPTTPGTTGLGSRPIFISGKVILSDNGTPSEPVKIEQVCGSNRARVDAYTDSKGRFNFQIGQTTESQDASVGGIPNNMAGLGGSGMNEQALWGCEIQANLPGYRSDRVSLSGTHYMDNPDIGTIVLHRLSNVEGFTISATSALAPKDARKDFEKALEAETKKNPDEAQKDLEKAVAIDPRYAAAWFELGRLYEQRDHAEEARKAYQQSIGADSKYLPPYGRLSWIALKDGKWQELADDTDIMLKLDPVDDPDAYYLSSIANLQLQKYDIAEKCAREAVRLDPNRKNMRSRYILGLALASKHAFAESAETLRDFLDASPNATDADVIRKQLAQVENAAKQASAQPPAPAQPQQ